MNFTESEAYLLSLGNEVSAMKLGLENIRRLLAELGDPQNNYLKVQIAGTNGKGSVCAFLGSICREAGVNAGVYTSPHLVSITERINIGGADITEAAFAKYATRVRDTAEGLLVNGLLEYRPTFFEQVTAIALLAFADAGVDVAILETGLGGRLDATTAANAEICAITRIDIDHQEYLGETLEEIAAEKAAIIRPDSVVVVGPQDPVAMRIISSHCSELGVAPISAQGGYEHLEIGLIGKHQIENAQIAIQVAKVLANKDTFHVAGKEFHWRVEDGIRNARHAGRLELRGKFLLDGSHNIGGAKALVEYLEEKIDVPVTMIFGMMKGKNAAGVLELLAPHVNDIVLTAPKNDRSLTVSDLARMIPDDLAREKVHLSGSVGDAIEVADSLCPNDGIILVTGSLYLVGEASKELNRVKDHSA